MVKSGIFANSLSPILRELIMVCISRNMQSPYCEARHSFELLKMTNLSYEEVVNVIDDQSHAIIPERFYTATRIAKLVLTSDCSKSREYIDELVAVGFSEEQAIEIMELMAAGVYISFFTKCLNVPIDSEIQAFLDKHKIIM